MTSRAKLSFFVGLKKLGQSLRRRALAYVAFGFFNERRQLVTFVLDQINYKYMLKFVSMVLAFQQLSDLFREVG